MASFRAWIQDVAIDLFSLSRGTASWKVHKVGIMLCCAKFLFGLRAHEPRKQSLDSATGGEGAPQATYIALAITHWIIYYPRTDIIHELGKSKERTQVNQLTDYWDFLAWILVGFRSSQPSLPYKQYLCLLLKSPCKKHQAYFRFWLSL